MVSLTTDNFIPSRQISNTSNWYVLRGILLLLAIRLNPSSSQRNLNKQQHSYREPFILSQYDQWCKSNCFSIESCDETFQDDFVDLQVQTNHSILDGPGHHLIFDSTYMGLTISKQTFETQFVMDISETSLGISPCKVYVLGIESVGGDYKNLLIKFRIYEVVHEEIFSLTRQVQNHSSLYYSGRVTSGTNQLVGLVIPNWDFTLRLAYAIDLVGGNETKSIDNELVLNQGSYGWCDASSNRITYYCEFEHLFEADLHRALSLSPSGDGDWGKNVIHVLFVKPSGLDSVIVTCRFMPPTNEDASVWLNEKMGNLIEMIQSQSSILYTGNVTFRIDTTWGLSKTSTMNRDNSKRLNRSVQPTPKDEYIRCKDTHRCSRGWNSYNQTTSESKFTTQLHAGGKHEEIFLFADFEDWRQGTKGWDKICVDLNATHSSCGMKHNRIPIERTKNPDGAHFAPFDYPSLGPSIPSFNSSYNNGLVLNEEHLSDQVRKQKRWISDLESYLQWIREEINITSLEAKTRFRKEIRSELMKTLVDYEDLLSVETNKLKVLKGSQCSNVDKSDCFLLFNSSSLELSGIINATGSLAFSPDGTEVAIWVFDSIDLGKEVTVYFTGQRAVALISKSSVLIDTKLTIRPGTLGGFPGGYSIARANRWQSVCQDFSSKTKVPFACDGDYPLSKLQNDTVSNNINGPGSASVRVYTFTIKISAKVVHEVQSIVTDANPGQVISGGFILHFNGYSSPFIPYDVTAMKLKSILEDSLNAAKINALGVIDRDDIVPGIGRVHVSRTSHGTSGGSEWKITFLTAIGNIGIDSTSLTATNYLNGIGATIKINTLVNGNSVGGTFKINFLNNVTRSMEHNISAVNMQNILKQDLPLIASVNVDRSGHQGENCYDGFCYNGPDQTGGYTWYLIITTTYGNLSPTSPTSTLFEKESKTEMLKVQTNLTGCVGLLCPNITVSRGHVKFAKEDRMTRPFSLSYGGGGGAYGNFGGKTRGPQGKAYGDVYLTNLYGGSGGALGFEHPFDVSMVGVPSRVRGGSGGGAIEIVGMNDIWLGPNSIISCNGEKGSSGFKSGGGGGSGGSILLSANGNLNIEGVIEARGGDGAAPIQKEIASIVGGGGSGGRIALYGKTVTSENTDVAGGICESQINEESQQNCSGSNGTLYKKQQFSLTALVDDTIGAVGTDHALKLKPSTSQEMMFWMDPRNQFRTEGPEFVFRNPGKPGRVSFFVRFGCENDIPINGWELLVALKDKVSVEATSKALFLSIGESIAHWFGTTQSMNEVNIHSSAEEKVFNTKFNQWYYVDIRLYWDQRKYDIFVDGFLIVLKGELEIQSMQSFSVYLSLSNVEVWLDEIFVGDDTSMAFQCPHMIANSNIEIEPIDEGRGWKHAEMGGTDEYKAMTRHDSHLSKRDLYNRPDNGGILHYDGVKSISFQTEIKARNEQPVTKHLNPGTILTLEPQEVDVLNQTTYYWYREHYNANLNGDVETRYNHFGGVAACSTTDFKSWKNEGIMLHYINLTDMVLGTPGPFHVERPSVLFNNITKKFVMWMIVDNENRSLAMAGVATSDYANGPFTFVRSFYPDGNKTRDQSLYKDSDGHGYLIRTFISTIEYTLPSAVMQPIWESVKRRDGSVHFPLTYHRAHYNPGYDDYHDIYLQRWRGEDKPWKIVCIDRRTKTEREIPYGREGIDICDNESEYKKVIGQGSPLHPSSKDGVKSRFLDPNDDENNAWKPSSVPQVKSQNWKANYDSGTCGKYLIGDDLDRYDPNLPNRIISNRKDCSNIVDNPIHPTLPDKRIGPQETILKRRVKYIAVSRLTEDYLDTTGEVATFEGELEDNTDLSAIVDKLKEELMKGMVISDDTTYMEKVHLNEEHQRLDWRTMLHQYELKEKDRSYYSLACVLDGKCPVDFGIE